MGTNADVPGIAPFPCRYHDDLISPDYFRDHKNLFPQAYCRGEQMARLAMDLAAGKTDRLAVFPPDYVVEAEAFGRRVGGYDDSLGPRITGAKAGSLAALSALTPPGPDSGRIPAVLQAVGTAGRNGFIPCLRVTGFFSFLEMILPLTQVFKAWRRQDSQLMEFVWEYGRFLNWYISEGLAAGARIVSYSDPLTGLEVVGRNTACSIAEILLIPFLKNLSGLRGPGIIHVCGVSTDVLRCSPEAECLEEPVPVNMSYTQYLLHVSGARPELIFYGNNCLHHGDSIRTAYRIGFAEPSVDHLGG